MISDESPGHGHTQGQRRASVLARPTDEDAGPFPYLINKYIIYIIEGPIGPYKKHYLPLSWCVSVSHSENVGPLVRPTPVDEAPIPKWRVLNGMGVTPFGPATGNIWPGLARRFAGYGPAMARRFSDECCGVMM
jgi:hypothetical protein